MSNVYLSLAEAHEKLAAGYRALADQEPAPAAAPAPVEQPEVTVSEALTETPSSDPKYQKELTKEEIRAVMSAKCDDGKTPQVKALLMKYDAGRLSGVAPEKYPDLMRELEAL